MMQRRRHNPNHNQREGRLTSGASVSLNLSAFSMARCLLVIIKIITISIPTTLNHKSQSTLRSSSYYIDLTNMLFVWQGLTKPRQMLVVKDTCMAAIEYFTEPGSFLPLSSSSFEKQKFRKTKFEESFFSLKNFGHFYRQTYIQPLYIYHHH